MYNCLSQVDEMLCQTYTFPIAIYLKLLSQEFIKGVVTIIWFWALLVFGDYFTDL